MQVNVAAMNCHNSEDYGMLQLHANHDSMRRHAHERKPAVTMSALTRIACDEWPSYHISSS